MSKLEIYTGIERAELDENVDIDKFYQGLFQLNQSSILLSKVATTDGLFKMAIETAVGQLDLDRVGILMLDRSREFMQGTWGTDDQGNIHSETDMIAPIDENVKKVIAQLQNRGEVCVWRNTDLYGFDKEGMSSKMGNGWNAAVGLWHNEILVGWIACDNLLNHEPFQVFQSHILRLFASIISAYRSRILAQEDLSTLNVELERKVAERTSELINAQRSLETINEELEHKVFNRTVTLSNKNSELKSTIVELKQTQEQLSRSEAQSAMKELVVGVAHEMNTPIGVAITASSAFSGLFQRLKTSIENSDEALFNQLLTDSETAAQIVSSSLLASSKLVSEFKRLSSMEVEGIPARKVNVENWLEQVILEAGMQDKQVSRCSIDRVLLIGSDVLVFRVEVLSQVLNDLLLNASQHGQQSEDVNIKISVTQNEQTHANTVSNQLEITIEDNGVGIDAKVRERMFNPFMTTGRSQGRKGLGLNVVYNLVYSVLHGELNYFESNLGGAGFRIQCPLEQ
jgi:signal transduction histidine kinase